MPVCPRMVVFACLTAALTVSVANAESEKGCTLAPSSIGAPGERIRSRDAEVLALRSHPEVVVAECRVSAAESRQVQATLRPNPELQFDVENFAGSGETRGLRSAETTAQVSQLIELGGKRLHRIEVAGLGRDVETWRRESMRLDVIAQTRKAFIGVVTAQERLATAGELVSLSRDLVRVVSARVKAGKVSPVEQTRAGVAATRTEIEVVRAEGELAAARQRLAAQWGQETPFLARAEEEFERILPLPDVNQLLANLERSPDLKRWASEMALGEASLSLAQAQRQPDITLGGGVRHFAEPDDVALLASISVPLPIFDRNQGNVAEARYRVIEIEAQRRAEHARLAAELQSAYQRLRASRAEVETIRDRVLPSANQALSLTRTGYQHGKFSYADVIEAQRAVFDVRQQYIDSLSRYHTDRADVNRQAATSSEDAMTSSNEIGDSR